MNAMRIFYISDANEPQNQVPLGCTKGNHPSKFQHAGVRRFGGVREQTNKHTNSLTDWRFYRVIENKEMEKGRK